MRLFCAFGTSVLVFTLQQLLSDVVLTGLEATCIPKRKAGWDQCEDT